MLGMNEHLRLKLTGMAIVGLPVGIYAATQGELWLAVIFVAGAAISIAALFRIEP
jgi:hypothetical protein